MKKLSQINSMDGASSLHSFAFELRQYLLEKRKVEEVNSYDNAIFNLRESMNKQIVKADKAEQVMRKGKTVNADKDRYEKAFSEAVRNLKNDLVFLPEEERIKWM